MALVTTRPAETGAVAGAAALLVGRLAGVDDADTITAIAVLLGFLPAAITWLVNLVRGRRTDA
jgi:hypothetical protein